MQCAQCHDHPLIETYYQDDYYGLFAFLNRSQLFTDTAKKVFFAEKSVGNVSFKSVFTEEAGETGPHLPGDNPVVEPYLQKLEESSLPHPYHLNEKDPKNLDSITDNRFIRRHAHVTVTDRHACAAGVCRRSS